jgi:hypothetical protein
MESEFMPLKKPEMTINESLPNPAPSIPHITSNQNLLTPSKTIDKAKVVCFFGKRGSGKTTTIRGQLKDCRPPIIIIDILGNFQSEEYFQCSRISDAISELQRQLKEQKFKIISLKTADPDLAVDFCSAALWEANGGTLILDEVDSISIAESQCFDQLIRYGRNKNVSILTGCRRPAEISRNITAGANSIYALKTTEPRDIEYYSSTVFGEKSYDLMRLPDFNGIFIDYDLGIQGFFKIDIQGNIFILKFDRL